MKSLERQVGGTHYVKMALQPNEFAMANGWDAGAYAFLKYVGRHADKGKLEDLKKADHYIDIRADLLPKNVQETGYIIFNGRLFAPLGTLAVYNSGIIPMTHYVQLNQIPPRDAQVLFTLEKWVMDSHGDLPEITEQLRHELSNLALYHYGELI